MLPMGYRALRLEKAKKNIEKIEELMINNILYYLKTGIFINNKPSYYMDAYTIVHALVDEGDFMSNELLTYHNQVIKNYILECKKELNFENNQNLIDKFLLYTEHINFLIFWMSMIFRYMDRFYTITKTKRTLAKHSMDLYKSIFFEAFKKDIFIEVDKLINEERNSFGTNESKAKIKSVIKILKEMNFLKPKIMSERKKIFWINESHYESLSEFEINNLWINEYFLKDTEKFIKNKSITDFQRMAILDYLSTQIKYLEEENERLKEYIAPQYHDTINKLNYKYLMGQYKKEFEITNEVIMKALEKHENTQLINMYQISKLLPDYLDDIEKELTKYIKNSCKKFFEDSETSKDKNKFFCEIVNLRKKMDILLSQCFQNDINFRGVIDRAFNSYLIKDKYAKQLSIYVDYYMRKGFRGKPKEEINNILDDIIVFFSCLNSKLIFQIDAIKKMSERLLKKESLSIINERSFVTKLKQEAGVSFVDKMQIILEDLEKNKNDTEIYKSLYHKGLPNGIKLDITVVSQYAWEIEKNYIEKIELPKFLSSCLDDFEKFFKEKYQNKNLIWCLGLSRLEIQYLYLKDKNISVSTLPQLLSLLLLEQKGELTLGEISQILKCKPETIIFEIQGLVYNPSFNPHSKKDEGIILGTFNKETKEFNQNDTIMINKKFTCQRFKFSTIPLKKKKSEHEKNEEEIKDSIIIQRYQNNILQSTLTRIMKSRIGIETSHEWLLEQAAEQIDLFKVQPQQIKENIEKLIEKGVIKRSDKNKSYYEYIA